MELMPDIILPLVVGGSIGIMYGEVRRALILRSESRERRRSGESIQLIGPLGETVFHKAPPPIKVVVDWGPLNATSELTFDKLEWVRFESPWGTVTFNLKGNQDGDH